MTNPPNEPPRQVFFDVTPEIHATDSQGRFTYSLRIANESYLETRPYDEMRFVFSLWHPSASRSIDLDRSYVELRASFDADNEHWVKIAEIEPVVAPYAGGESFDGWIVLPVLSTRMAFALVGSGFEARARLQARASLYLVP
ncbi:MAG: hypothetical protein K0U98_22365 [Deltaproteobacteria bacterium]|nr:hypothetical protein [Deltaproteobacteria bacterium]